jgi:hypothetical protein
MQTLLTTRAEAADAELHYTKRPDLAKFSASTLVQTLVLGWLAHPDATIEQLAQTAARVGVDVRPQAIDQRFTFATASLLRSILSGSLTQLIAADPVAIPLLQRFAGVRVQDSTTIVLPDLLAAHAQGCGGQTETNTAAALKCGLQLDLCSGAFTQFDLADGRASDRRLPLNRATLPPGSLRLADLGFLDLEVLATIELAGAYWLSKLTATVTLRQAGQQPLALLPFIERLGPHQHWEGQVWVGQERPVQARLLVQAVPQEVADQRRRRIRSEARRKGRTPSATALALAAWTILITNVPAELLSLEEALVLAKVRWQIELVFKLWKSHGLIDQWRSGKPARILCELYAKLLAMVLQQWALIVGCWAYPERSLVKAAQVVREHAPQLASARARLEQLAETLASLQQVMQRTCRLNPRQKHPNTYQVLLALSPEEAAACQTAPVHATSTVWSPASPSARPSRRRPA